MSLTNLMEFKKEEFTIGEWIDIKENPPEENEMVVFKAFNVEFHNVTSYTTYPYCGWVEGEMFVRWPHEFPPTHYFRLPK